MLNEFYQVRFRKKLCSTIEELQRDADQWIDENNEGRPHSGRYCFGKTPMQTFLDSLELAKERMIGIPYR
jgi:hypothetical protein